MNMFRSLRTKIMLGFVAVLSIAIVCFTTTLFIAREFRRVDTERVAAVRQLREAVTAGDLVKAAEAKLSDYLRSGSVASAHEMLERVSAVAQVGGISGSGTDWEALKRLAAATVETIDAAAEANKNLADLTGTLGNPGAALGWNAGDPALVSETSHLQFSLGQYALAASRFAATGDVRLLEAVKAESVRIGASADAIAGFPGAGDGTKKRIQALRRLAGSTDAAVRDLKAALDKRQETSNQLIAQIQKIANDAAKVQTSANGHFDAAAKEAEASSDRLFEALVASTLVVACAGIGLAILLGGSIARPILALKEAIARIASGDLGSAIPGMERLDEIGQMAKSVQIFRDNGVRLRETETAAEELRRAAEAERARNDALTARSAAQQKHVVEVIASGLERLANGELIYRIQDSFPAEYLKLRDDFNGAMQKLQEAMTLVSVNTSTIHNGTHEISSASDDLSRRTGQQAASLEELTATLNQIATTVRKTAEGAKNAREIVTGTKTGAEQSQSIVDDAVNAMGGIEKSAGQISQIVGLIDEIAFQTNLLALNAGVEAARAGDAGRGFAVVASEVRALAQRSAEASKEIKALIDASSRQVGQGVDLVRRTGVALRTIITQVGEINTIVTEIAQSAAAQAGSLDEVKAVFSQMDQVTQQNAAMAEESTAASRALTRDTEELAVLIGRFEVGQAVPPGAGARAKSAVRH